MSQKAKDLKVVRKEDEMQPTSESLTTQSRPPTLPWDTGQCTEVVLTDGELMRLTSSTRCRADIRSISDF